LLNPHSERIPDLAASAKEDLRIEKEIGKNSKIIKLAEQQLAPELESGNDVTSFLSAVRAAATASCESIRGE